MLSFKSESMKSSLKNILWLIMDKGVRLSLGVFVVALMARYLGPESYGVLSFAIAIMTVLLTISGLGLNGIVVRDLISEKRQKAEILGTAFYLNISAAVLGYVFLTGAMFFLYSGDNESQLVILIVSMAVVFKSYQVFNYWFESQIRSKYTVWAENSAFFLASALKVLMVLFKAPLIVFALIIPLEAVVAFLVIYWFYSKSTKDIVKLKFNFVEAKRMLREGWPLIISAAAWIVYTKIDQIMIGQMLGNLELGYYSAATRLSEAVNFLPAAIAFSLIPIATKLKDKDIKAYDNFFQFLYALTVLIMVAVAVVFSFGSSMVVHLLFGNEYSQSSGVLSISVWSGIFVAMAVVSGRHMINEGLQKLMMLRSLIGATLNIILNFALIPVYGIEGAAYSSLAVLIVVSYLFDAFNKSTRAIFSQKTKAISMLYFSRLLMTKYKLRSAK